jgi:hypothetical protein
MAGGKPISLMAVPDYEIRSRLTQAIYADGSPDGAARTARQLGVSYVFVGPDEERVHPLRHWRKLESPARISSSWCFSNSRTRIYEIVQRP